MPPRKVLISAGEASGDYYASLLVNALRQLRPDLEFFGCTGPKLREQDVRTVVDAADLAVVGLLEVVAHLPRIYRRHLRLVDAFRREKPDLAILTDSPDFHLPLAKKLKKAGIPVIYLVAPQVWAWRKERLPQLRRNIDCLLCIFPFEEEFFRKHGINAEYIGHPLAKRIAPSFSHADFFARHQLDLGRPMIAILPGSRSGELRRHLPPLAGAVERMRQTQDVQFLLALPRGGFADRLGPEESRVVSSAGIRKCEGEAWDALKWADVAWTASGTVTIEAALLGAPMVTYYRVAPQSWWIGRRLVDVPFFTMVNLVAGSRVVPELMQDEMTPESLVRETLPLLDDGKARETMRQGLREVAEKLTTPHDPIERAADVVEKFLVRKKLEKMMRIIRLLPILLISCSLWAQDTGAEIDVERYNIVAEVNPATQTLSARVEVKFTTQASSARTAMFELNNALRISKITNAAGEILTSDRSTDKHAVTVNFPQALAPNTQETIAFEYDGRLSGKEDSPVFGLRFAAIKPEFSYLLYPSRWFPVSGYTTDRFAATLRVTVPEGKLVLASGVRTTEQSGGGTTYIYEYNQPSFPGSLAVVDGQAQSVSAEGITTLMYFRGEEQNYAQTYGELTAKLVNFYTGMFGMPPSASLTLVETEEGAPFGYSAPGMVFLSPGAISEDPNVRVLANQISRQWWGGLVSPSSRDHIWLTNGLARYSEELYTEETAGEAALEQQMRETFVDALTVEEIPVLQAARYDDYSPEFWALSGAKGAAVLHMLRFVMGDEKFKTLLKEFPSRYANQSVSTVDFRKVAEELHGDNLQPFFIQWIQTTGAPQMTLDYTIFRTDEGFRIMGKVTQDLDTFRMPVELKIETEGNPEFKTVEVVGNSSEFLVETFAKPKKVEIDPNRRLLRYDPDIRVDVAIRRGEQFAEIGEFGEALKEYQKALDVNRNSSLAHYRIAEIFFLQNNYQSAANEFREALNGDLRPKWTEVWSHISLGKIFDLTNQRERAMNEYQQAIRTKDNTQGAQEEASKYLEKPYQRQDSQV